MVTGNTGTHDVDGDRHASGRGHHARHVAAGGLALVMGLMVGVARGEESGDLKGLARYRTGRPGEIAGVVLGVALCLMGFPAGSLLGSAIGEKSGFWRARGKR